MTTPASQDNSEAQQASNHGLMEQLIKVRKKTQTRLARYSNLPPEDVKEVYLFKEDQFCGVRFTLGAFRAVWYLEQTCVNIFRGETAIDRIELDAPAKRAA